MTTHIIQSGSYFLQGWIGWGQPQYATRMTEKEAIKMLKRVRAAGCGNAFVVPLADVLAAQTSTSPDNAGSK